MAEIVRVIVDDGKIKRVESSMDISFVLQIKSGRKIIKEVFISVKTNKKLRDKYF